MAPDTISQLKMLSWKWCQGSRTDPNIRYMEDIWPHQLKHPMVKIVLWWLISEKHTSERPAEPSWDVREVHRHGMGKRGLLLEIASDSCSDKWSVSSECVLFHTARRMTPSAYGQLWEPSTLMLTQIHVCWALHTDTIDVHRPVAASWFSTDNESITIPSFKA